MWTDDLFGVQKPIIALLHIRALPGDPKFNRAEGLAAVIDMARRELHALQDGGVDGLLFANEFSLPYQHVVSHVTTAAMGRIIGELLSDIRLPFGVNVVLNPMATIDLAAATGARFVRSTFTGAYIGESGITNTDVASYVRRKMELGLDDLRLLYKVNPESDADISGRDIAKTTRSILFHCDPDGLCVSGDSAGLEANSDDIAVVKKIAGDVPVFCSTGCTACNIRGMLERSDGAFVGTSLKAEGKFNNLVDPVRVKDFMSVVKKYREVQ
jgi:membrane complex biogenesis BtpA family protein